MRTRVVQEVREQILNGDLTPGSPISERLVSEAAGVSRVPAREALIQLENMGLVRLIAGKGAFVRTLSAREIRDLYEIRQSLEGRAARSAAERGPRERFKDYGKVFAALLASPAKASAQRLYEASSGFHELIKECCDNELLISLLSDIRDQVTLTRSRAYLHVSTERHFDGVKEHMKILDAIVSGDGDVAEGLMRNHISTWMERQMGISR